MARSAVLDVKVLVDAAQAASGLNDTAAKFESFGKKLVGAVVGAVAIRGVTDLAKSVVGAASTMEQAIGGTDKVFGTSADEIHDWAKDTSDAIRLPAVAVEQYATLIKTQLAATGQPMAALVTQTKALIQVGADLSAVTGRDLADSIAAVKSALAGEYDPIQNLGVAMSGASVQARALEIAHGDVAAAASDSVIMQARVAEIMDKSAFATGAAADEANSFQGRMDSLNEKVQNLAAAVGGPLLDSLGNIVGGITDAAAGAETLGVGLGTMLGTVLSLPGPIQAIVAGLAAFGVVSAVWGTKVAGGFASFIGQVRTATGSVSGLKAALAGIGPALGGGALIVGAAVLVGLFATAIGRVTEGAKKGEDALGAYRDAIVAAGGASTDATAEAFKQAVTTSDAFKGLVTEGFSASEAVSILTGTQEDWIAVQSSGSDAARNLTKDTSTMVDGFIDANGHAKDLALAQIEGAKAMDGNSAAVDTNAQKLAADQAAADAAAKEQKALAEALKAAQAAADATTGSRMLAGIKQAADDAGRAVDLFSAQMDAFTQKNETSSNVLFDFTDGLRGLNDKFKDSEGHIKVNVDALAAFDTAAIASDGNATDLSRSLDDQATIYDKMVAGAYSAALATGTAADATAAAGAAADSARGQFVDYVAGVLGGGDEAIAKAQAIADQYGILGSTQIPPAIFEIIADDHAAQAAVQKLKDAGNNPVTFQLEAGPDGALHTVDDVISYIDAAGTKAEVAVHANATPAEGTVNEFTGEKRQTNEVAILANSAPARNAMNAFLSDYSKMTLTATLNGNTGPARSAVEAFRNDYGGVSVTATILGNSAPARSAIAAVENGSYSATIRIIADTSSFLSSFNSLPSTKPISLQQQRAPTFAAPTLAVTPTATGAPVGGKNLGTASVVINVSGAIDPDSTARQVLSLLERRARRTGGIVI